MQRSRVDFTGPAQADHGQEFSGFNFKADIVQGEDITWVYFLLDY